MCPPKAAKLKPRSPWEDQFREPSLDELREGIGANGRRLFDQLNEGISAFEGISSELSWEGVPWRWCLVFRHEASPDEAWAFLCPSPEGPEVCVPVESAFVDTLPFKRLKKHARDTIVKAKKVGTRRWPSWTPSSRSEVEDILDVVKRKHKHAAASEEE